MVGILLFTLTILILIFKIVCCEKTEKFMDVSGSGSIYFYDSILFDDSTANDHSLSVSKDIHYLKYI